MRCDTEVRRAQVLVLPRVNTSAVADAVNGALGTYIYISRYTDAVNGALGCKAVDQRGVAGRMAAHREVVSAIGTAQGPKQLRQVDDGDQRVVGGDGGGARAAHRH